MNELIFKAAKIITALTSIHVGLAALGYDFCKPFHGFKFYLDVISGIAGVIVLVKFFMHMQS
jgi:hypothetical protein